MEHEHTEHVAVTPDAVYGAIADISNLPWFVPQIMAVRSASDGGFEVDARYGGHEQHGEASFAADDEQRRVEWSSPSGYHGWMKVDPDGDGSRLTLFLKTTHDAERDHDVAATKRVLRKCSQVVHRPGAQPQTCRAPDHVTLTFMPTRALSRP